MKYTIGIDIGGSSTKIVGFDENKNLIKPILVKASDPVTSAYGAFGKFTSENNIQLDEIGKIKMTGVGAAFMDGRIFGKKFDTCREFSCVGLGGLYISGLDRCVVVSMGTGTSMVYAEKDSKIEYLGGTGVGGGTLVGLSKLLLGSGQIDHLISLAENGNIENIDLQIKNLTKKGNLPDVPLDLTAANFGNVSADATKEDIATGLLNMVFETVGMCAIFAARKYDIRDIVLT